jgi:hypothetical protein
MGGKETSRTNDRSKDNSDQANEDVGENKENSHSPQYNK